MGNAELRGLMAVAMLAWVLWAKTVTVGATEPGSREESWQIVESTTQESVCRQVLGARQQE